MLKVSENTQKSKLLILKQICKNTAHKSIRELNAPAVAHTGTSHIELSNTVGVYCIIIPVTAGQD